MKRIIAALFAITLMCGCHEKEEDIRPINIQGRWYGHVDEHYVSKPKKHIFLDLERGTVHISRVFQSYTSGWYDSEGTYTQESDGTIRFNIQMTPSGFFKDDHDIPIITLTHAEPTYDDISGEMLKVHFTKKYRDDYFDEELRGTETSHYIWFDRERPDLSPEED